MKKIKALLLIMLAILLLAGCKKDKTEKTGRLTFHFSHLFNNSPVKYDTLAYTNQKGTRFMIDQIQYFITDVTLHNSSGGKIIISKNGFWHYVDKDIPSTLTWAVDDAIPAGTYDSISLTFGFSKEKNKTGLFVNPPECNMSWPEYLGGGYHYMKMNLKYLDSTNYLQNFGFHLGIGQLYAPDSTITGFVHNNFNVTLPGSAFTLNDNQTKEISLVMNIDEWFKNPHDFDFTKYGMGIMQNENGMKEACDNGHDVFKISSIK